MSSSRENTTALGVGGGYLSPLVRPSLKITESVNHTATDFAVARPGAVSAMLLKSSPRKAQVATSFWCF